MHRLLRLAALSPILAAACNDTGVKVYHEPPTVAIIEPADGSTFYEGQIVTFRGQVSVLDGSDLTEITHQWVANSNTICISEAVPADGLISCETIFDDAGEVAVTVTATNARADRATDSVDIVVDYNEPPSVELINPTDGDTLQSRDLVVFQANIADLEDEADDLLVTITSSQDGDLAVPANGTTAGTYSGSAYLSGGNHLLTITVTDTAGKSAQDTATVRVNDPPSAPVVTISPTAPISEQVLTASIVTPATDPENDPISYRYDWHVNGDTTPYSSGTNPNLNRGITQRDEFWEVYVYAYDGSAYGNPGIASVTIGNAPPSVDSVTFNPTAPHTTDTVECVPQGFYDPEGDAEEYDFVWYHNGTLDAAETTEFFPYSKTIKGDTLRCEVTPYDDFEDGATVSSATITVLNTPPTQPTVVITPGAAEPEDALVCQVAAPSTDADGDTISYDYEWWQNGILTSNYTYQVSASATTHGDTWECRITPNDGEDDGSYGSDTVSVADVTAPGNPTINSLDRYTNDEEVNLAGTCEADCDLTFYFSDSTGSWTETAVCSSSGTYTHTTYVTRGYSTAIYATCTDSASNVSGNSNTVNTEACDPEDTYETSNGAGNSGAAAINAWTTLNDSASATISIEGNILNSTDQDWYLVTTSDSASADISAGYDAYNFQVNFVAGGSDYTFLVYDGGYQANDRVCPASGSGTGYTEFDFYNEDVGEGVHSIPSDTRACSSSGSSSRNTCTDYTTNYYIQVIRNPSSSPSCQHYELEITNGLAP
ncbi:MAG: hypothetical protein H6739_05290 [Alphaproteobacteria bacterium]|nr:hypothetical protein [Alphaproteobacteria bacterium]